MIRSHGEQRSLIQWLIMQEKVLHLWIDELISAAPKDEGFLTNLETHSAWLSMRIDELTGRAPTAPSNRLSRDIWNERGHP